MGRQLKFGEIMKILAFGAHPDDIEVGMGGTIAKHSRKKHELLCVIATIPDDIESRKEESEKSAKILNAKLSILGLDPDEMLFNRKLVRIFDGIIKDFAPDVVYTHWEHDSHQDHAAISNASITATRKNNCSVYMYEQTIPGGIVPYGFKPQVFIDISDVIDTKIKSVLAHKSQVKKNGNWWEYGIRGRAMYRGYQINVKYAEAFEVVKEIKKI